LCHKWPLVVGRLGRYHATRDFLSDHLQSKLSGVQFDLEIMSENLRIRASFLTAENAPCLAAKARRSPLILSASHLQRRPFPDPLCGLREAPPVVAGPFGGRYLSGEAACSAVR